MYSNRISKVLISLSLILMGLTLAVGAWAQANPVPFLIQPLTPASMAPGGNDFTLTVFGTGFTSGSKVRWNDKSLNTTLVSNSELTAQVPAAYIHKPTTAQVSVGTPAPGGGVSNAVFFQVTTPTKSLQFTVADYPLGFQPGGIAVGDFNGDGLLDIAVTNSAKNGAVEVLLSNGDGRFIPRRSVVPLNSPTAVLAADFNGDGKLDLAVKAAGGPPNYVAEVLLGKGDGTFQRRSVLGGLDSMGGMATGDFNSDGKLDMAIVDISRYGDAWLRLSLGNGDGTFQSTIRPPNLHPQPSGIAAGDFNGDGNLDVAITNLDAGWDIRREVDLLLGAGDGTFQFSSFYGPPSNFVGPIAADFNGDHKLDLVAARKDVGMESVLLGDGTGSFQHPVYNFSTTAAPSSPVLGDFNGDGYLDLLLSDTGSTLFTMLGEGNGRFQIQVSTQGAQLHQIAAGDFNNDGALDLVAIGDLEISILTQEGTQ